MKTASLKNTHIIDTVTVGQIIILVPSRLFIKKQQTWSLSPLTEYFVEKCFQVMEFTIMFTALVDLTMSYFSVISPLSRMSDCSECGGGAAGVLADEGGKGGQP